MDKWQPIETAPKDRTTVIVFDPLFKTAPQNKAFPHIGYWCEFWPKSRWRLCGSASVIKPTHWMPLPDPPDT